MSKYKTFILSALYFSYLCYWKVPWYLQIETRYGNNETSSKFSYHIRIGLFCIFAENEVADWLRGLTSKQWQL